MNEVVRGVDLNALGSPHETLGGMLEVRFTNTEGNTEVWMVPNNIDMDADSFPGDAVGALRGYVKMAYVDSGVDSRIGTLLHLNEVLRQHVETHHDELSILYRREFGTGYDCQQYLAKKTDGSPSPTS